MQIQKIEEELSILIFDRSKNQFSLLILDKIVNQAKILSMKRTHPGHCRTTKGFVGEFRLE
jgi:LysR family hydrogen peroxide-inducible transcriptional activator